MIPSELSALLDATLNKVTADGTAIGVAIRATTSFACRGAVAGWAVVARISGEAIDALAATTLFDPLRLAAMRLGGEPVRLPGAPEIPGTIGDGGLWTSITDLTRWLMAMNDGTRRRGAQHRQHRERNQRHRLPDRRPLGVGRLDIRARDSQGDPG